MEFGILGPLEISHEGRAVRIGAAKERALLVRLLIDGGRVVSVDRLVEDLWQGEPPESANVSVRVHVSRVRKALEAAGAPKVLVTEHPGYRLGVEPDALDVERFDALVAAGRASLAAGDNAAASERFAEALGLWRGGALADVSSYEFARAEIARLEEARLTALEDKIEADLALGRHGSMVGELEALTHEHPLRERLWGQRMVALYRSGRQADALAVYQKLRTTLADELGIDPSPELARLETQILVQAPELRAQPISSAAERPTGVVTFMLTDIEGSTALWDAHQDAMAKALERHDELIAERVETAGGVLLQSKGEGDSTVSAFRKASAAASAAMDIQRAIDDEEWPADVRIAVRIALHTGEAYERGGNYYGPALNRAARLRSLAPGRHTVVSRATAELIHDHLPVGAVLVDLGTRSLQGLSREEHVFELLPKGSSGDIQTAQRSSSAAHETAQRLGTLPLEMAARFLLRPPLPAPLRARQGSSFVGRQEEQYQLTSLWRKSEEGGVRAAFIAGEPGIGKTRLATEFAAAAHEQGAVILFGRSDEETLIPYQPFVEALRAFVASRPEGELREVAGPSAGELVRLIPDLPRLIPDLPPPIQGDPDGERYRLFEAVADLLNAIAQNTPVILMLDDLHWADKPTLLLLRHVLRREELGRVFIVGTYRETELARTHPLSETLADLRRERQIERVVLRGLSEDDVEAFIRNSTDSQADPALTHAVYRETEGNPFFVGEVIRHLREVGTDIDLERIGIPEGIKEVVGRRVARLSGDGNAALAAASVIGREFSLDVLTSVSELEQNRLIAALEEAVRAGIVDEVPGQADRYAFSHALVRQTLYEELNASRRIRLHQQVAAALEAMFGEEIEVHLAEIAYHFSQAARRGETEKAIDYAVRAGDRAMTLLAYEEAAEQYRRALQALELDANADEGRRRELLLAVAGAHARSGDMQAARSIVDDVAASARENDAAEDLARAALLYVGLEVSGPLQEEHRRVKALLEEAAASLPPTAGSLRARVLARLTHTIWFTDFERVAALSREALEVAKASGDPEAITSALGARLYGLWVDAPEERTAIIDELLRVALDSGDRELELTARSWKVLDLAERAGIEELDQEINDYIDLESRLRQPIHNAVALGFRAARTLLEGRFDEGEELAREAFRIRQDIEPTQAGAYLLGQTFFTWVLQGTLATKAAEIQETLRGYVSTTNAAGVASGFGTLLIEMGEIDQAREFFSGLAADGFRAVPRDIVWGNCIALFAEMCSVLGEVTHAPALYDLLLPFEGRFVVVGPPLMSLIGPFSYYLGVLAETMQKHDLAEQHFVRALESASKMGAVPDLARINAAYGRTLLARGGPGDVDRAHELFSSALATAEELGMKPLAKRVRSQLRPSLSPALTPSADEFFVGREQELGKLTSLWGEARGGTARTALISGEPGIGKTRLAAEFARRAYADGAVVLYGRSDEDAGVPNQPFVEALTSYLARCGRGELDEHVARYGGDLTRLVPMLGRRIPEAAQPVSLDPEFERYRVFEAVTGMLSDASKRTPIVLVLDDLHWATRPTLLLLRHILRSDAPLRLLVVGTYRETDLDRAHPLAEALADFRREHSAERIPLTGFDAQGVFDFLEASAGHALGDVPNARDFARALHAETEGNPFFILEVLSHLAETGAAYQKEGRWTSDLSIEEIGLPQGIREAVARRLSLLSEPTNKALAVAAVAGITFSVDLLERIPEADPSTLLDALDEAHGVGLIVEGETPGVYRFAHSLVRQTLAAEISSIRRIRLHRRIAEAMEQLHERDPDPYLPELARHFFEAAQGGDVAKAVEYSKRAGEQAMQLVAYEEAAEQFRRALEALSLDDADDERRADLLLALGEAESRRGDVAAAKETFREAADLARTIGSADRLARAALGFGVGAVVGLVPIPQDQELTALIEEALAAIGPDDNPLRVRLLARLTSELAEPESATRLETTSREAVEIAERLGDPSAQFVALEARLWASMGPGATEEQSAGANRMLRIAEELGDGEMAMRGRHVRLRSFFEVMKIQEAEQELDAMAALAEDLRQPLYRWLVVAIRSGLAIVDGRFEEGDELASETWSLGQRALGESLAAVASGVLYYLKSFWQGRFAEAEQIIVQATEYMPAWPGGLAAIASTATWAGDLDRALSLFEELAANDFAGIPRDSYWASTMSSLIACSANLGDARRATILYDLALREEGRGNVSGGPLILYSGPWDIYIGMLEATIGRWEKAQRRFDSILNRPLRTLPRVFPLQVRLSYARLFLSRGESGDRDRAVEQLELMIAVANELGSHGWAERARELMP